MLLGLLSWLNWMIGDAPNVWPASPRYSPLCLLLQPKGSLSLLDELHYRDKDYLSWMFWGWGVWPFYFLVQIWLWFFWWVRISRRNWIVFWSADDVAVVVTAAHEKLALKKIM